LNGDPLGVDIVAVLVKKLKLHPLAMGFNRLNSTSSPALLALPSGYECFNSSVGIDFVDADIP
jgi:hypothetical protein